MTELFVGLALAAIGAVTLLAYRHPGPYRLVLKPAIEFVGIMVLLFLIGHDQGVHRLEMALHEGADSGKVDVLSLPDVSFGNTPYLVAFSVIAFLWILRFLPDLGITTDPAAEANGKDSKNSDGAEEAESSK